MTLRNVPKSYTLEEQRQEVNLIAVDVDDIDLTLETRAKLALSVAAEPTASGNGDLAYDNATGIFTYTPPALTLDDITTNGNTTTNAIIIGGLTVNTNNSNFGGNIYITDATKEFGFYENGKITVVDTATPGVGSLTLAHRDGTGEETLAKFTRDGGAELYYNADKKLETTSTGVTVTGSVASSTLRIGTSPGTVATVEIDGTITSSTHTFTPGSVIQFTNAGGGAEITQIGNNSVTTGDLTANTIVKSGGTSAEFLKADGSVDTTTYLSSYTETDPVFSASEAASITSTDTTNWDTAYGWGDHGAAGYLTTETDPVVGAITGIVKADGAGNISAAVAGTDYATAAQGALADTALQAETITLTTLKAEVAASVDFSDFQSRIAAL